MSAAHATDFPSPRSCDHRHIYGADAAKFLVDLAQLLEEDTMSLLM